MYQQLYEFRYPIKLKSSHQGRAQRGYSWCLKLTGTMKGGKERGREIVKTKNSK